jgi:hypothetical protein
MNRELIPSETAFTSGPIAVMRKFAFIVRKCGSRSASRHLFDQLVFVIIGNDYIFRFSNDSIDRNI